MSTSGPDAGQDDMHEPPIMSGRPSEASHSEDHSMPTTQRKGAGNSKPLQCENPCECCCHDTKLTRASPPWLAPLFGNLYLPCSFFRRSLTSCNIQTCRRTQKNRQIAKIKFFFPSWFIAVDMKIRLQVFPVHLCLQTPRRVPRTSPIFRCIQRIDIEGVKELLVSGKASVNDVDERGWSVLHHAADLVDYHPYDQACGMLQFLVDEGAHTEWEEEQFHWTPLQFLQQYGLLQQQQESNTGAVSLIQTKIAGPILHGNLIDAWEDWLERCDFSDVHRAVLTNRTRNTSLKDMLASTVADINAPCRRMGRTPLEWGIYLHIPNVVETLLECGADVHKGYPLHQAIFLGDLDALKLLIHAGADLNLQIGDGQTPLHIAAYYGEIEFVEELIRICGDTLNLDVLDNDGHSALDTAKAHRIHYIEMGWQTDGHDKIILTLSKLQKSSDGMPECSRQTHACIEAIEDLRVPGSFPMN
ncbi:hypothetical protein PHLCEN_2v4085 [Hermanssonia centrifuga]|uniref:Uncharacterized protein n=1 Tax=Hermanssonia centrifuga TaxID=98765 RepID=A0A2R6Q2D7_9APHY|nr:hypothetical protein PHLCEN_2v4085 [Hermanssonia centrifuga]